ncbi:hypothetical protein [Rheinheimera baltica]|uniref:Secreted protein n=1 Tax=Rheinheimera baltica TaxID=67576 RepID=A0ABT9I037_9GAMM|nr:hypothetical protein [Rheinheimera baltica]MDP5136306.1 hypothetical protein [Rheinheimera baltica]MDP5144650.1 hypothetical protein [Rheinheimera baltica]MDP5190793.1 hypothetical protein [Rheinheimera baltica]
MHRTLFTTTIALSFSAIATADIVQPAPLVSIASHDAYFDNLRAHCGKAFAGKVVMDTPKSDGFDGSLIMHVRKCSDSQLQIPFHVGDNHSRTWIITKTGSGLSLKHDHRNKDGSHDVSTMYGGHTTDAGWSNVQSFPADQYSKELFSRLGNPQSNTNIWQMYIYPQTFTYRLIREGREFRVDFDLTKPVALPPTPWGYKD